MHRATESDVIIVGGGPAGIAAAISAARQGVKVLLIKPPGVWAVC